MIDDEWLMKALRAPQALEALGEADLQRVMNALVARLGAEWSRAAATSLVHAPTGHEFALVSGGRMIMGLHDEDIEEASKHADWTSGIARYVDAEGASARPPREVDVRPFICARHPLPKGLSHDDAVRAARDLGFRLPSEAELEWIARDGGRYGLFLGARAVAGRPGSFTFEPSRFGLEDLTVAHWAADDWHASYDGAPATSEPWMGGDPAGVCRNTFALSAMVSEDDVAALLVALRTRGRPSMPSVVRLARDLALS